MRSHAAPRSLEGDLNGRAVAALRRARDTGGTDLPAQRRCLLDDARHILLQDVAVALQRGGRLPRPLDIIGGVAITLFERQTRVLVGLAFGLGPGERHERALQITELARATA